VYNGLYLEVRSTHAILVGKYEIHFRFFCHFGEKGVDGKIILK
jgi:hypothetical protein